jgi:AsmA protein
MAALLFLVLLFVGAGIVLARVVASSRAQRFLTTRIEQAFGRTVEVSVFDLRWFPTPGIIAHNVTIGEDPRFGREYFLRAESVVAGLRWKALFAGRLELGTLELSQPSLNLVRNADGQWNVESWLPAPQLASSARESTGPKAPHIAAQLSRIEIDGGHINFNRGLDRRPFALVDLAGSIEQESPGRWRIDLAARPSRAIVHLQETGTLHLTGLIAGTSARLHPADLTLTWSNASLADAMRLALGNDPGVRGGLALQLTAHSEPVPAGTTAAAARWELSISARLDGLHRWDMVARPDNPALSVQAAGAWQADASQVQLRNILVEGPHSNVAGAGSVDWSHGINPDVRVTSSGVAFDDLLAWYRAFQPGVADGLTADGFLSGNSEIKGWPARVGQGEASSGGAAFNLNGASLAKSAPIHARFGSRGGIELAPAIWTFESAALEASGVGAGTAAANGADDTLTFDAKLSPPEAATAKKPAPVRWGYELGLSGDVTHMERILAAARTFGRPLNAGWDVEGGLSGELRWHGNLHEQFPKPVGFMILHKLALKLPLLNQPIGIEDARIDLKGGERRVTISSAEALGAHWQGTIIRREVTMPGKNPGAARTVAPGALSDEAIIGPPDWEFDLAADRLDASDLDRWLGPRARPGWIARLFSPQGPAAPAQILGPGPLAQVRARGTIDVEEFALAPLEAQKLHAQIDLQGRVVNISQFDANLNGGSIEGGLLASLEADPDYRLHATITNVNAADLAAASAALRGRLAGQLSGSVRLSLHGIGRENLLDSLKGEGRISAVKAGILDLDVTALDGGAPHEEINGQFSEMNAEFSIAAREIRLEKISLLDDKESFEGAGTADFTRTIRIELRPRQQAGGVKPVRAAATDGVYRVTGLLESPRVSFVQAPSGASQFLPAPGRH